MGTELGFGPENYLNQLENGTRRISPKALDRIEESGFLSLEEMELLRQEAALDAVHKKYGVNLRDTLNRQEGDRKEMNDLRNELDQFPGTDWFKEMSEKDLD